MGVEEEKSVVAGVGVVMDLVVGGKVEVMKGVVEVAMEGVMEGVETGMVGVGREGSVREGVVVTGTSHRCCGSWLCMQ